MTYITLKQHRKPVQLKFEDVLFGSAPETSITGVSDRTGTITRCVDHVPEEILDKFNVSAAISWLKNFNEKNSDLFAADRDSLYRHYKIPKKTGGWRPIDEPCEKLQSALGELAKFLQEDCEMLYHTAAFAYIKDRSIVDAVKKHANFKSNWFLKTDVSGAYDAGLYHADAEHDLSDEPDHAEP